MSSKAKFLCGVPNLECNGTKLITDQRLGEKAHSSPEDAFRCYANYLIKRGYRRISTREFEHPTTKEILVISRRSKFGSRLRTGKEGQRFMPTSGYQGTIIG